MISALNCLSKHGRSTGNTVRYVPASAVALGPVEEAIDQTASQLAAGFLSRDITTAALYHAYSLISGRCTSTFCSMLVQLPRPSRSNADCHAIMMYLYENLLSIKAVPASQVYSNKFRERIAGMLSLPSPLVLRPRGVVKENECVLHGWLAQIVAGIYELPLSRYVLPNQTSDKFLQSKAFARFMEGASDWTVIAQGPISLKPRIQLISAVIWRNGRIETPIFTYSPSLDVILVPKKEMEHLSALAVAMFVHGSKPLRLPRTYRPDFVSNLRKAFSFKSREAIFVSALSDGDNGYAYY